MRLFKRIATDKSTAIQRAFFDADRGCIALAMERIADIRYEFPQDAASAYAEGLLRKDFLGQGRRALELFRSAQKCDPTHLFSAFNVARYADTEKEYRQFAAHARQLAPDDPDLRLFKELDEALDAGQTLAELLQQLVVQAQQHGKHGECAAAVELAIGASEWSRSEELQLRHARCGALRELDRAEDAARQVRREEYLPCERLALDEALAELDRILELDPSDPKMFNFKSAWLILKRRYEEAVVAADAALAIQPTGYLKPLTNKAWTLYRLGRLDEGKEIAQRVIALAKDLGSEFADDLAKVTGIIESIATPAQETTDEQRLATIAENCARTASLTAAEARNVWQAKTHGFDLTRGIQGWCVGFGQEWHQDYVTQMAELLHDFCPEWLLLAILDLGTINQAACTHYLHAALFVAAQADGVMEHDACRFNALVLLGPGKPELIRGAYREAVLAPAAVDERFAPLAERMRRALERLHPELPRLLADQPPLEEHELVRARSVTLSRFVDGVSRYPTSKRGASGCAGVLATAVALVGVGWCVVPLVIWGGGKEMPCGYGR